MSGEDTPQINSVNDYLTAVLPICFGALNMTAQEIYDSTPWEINMRIKGFEERQKLKRIFTASFLTVPILNSGFNRPKKGIKLKDVIPDDLQSGEVTQSELDKWREILNKAERGSRNG